MARFTDGWRGVKSCKECGGDFLATSGSRRFCDSCMFVKTICPVCGGEKSLYCRFCDNSCAGKWKYQNSEKVRAVIKAGILIAHANAGENMRRYWTGRPRFNMRGENNPNWGGGTYGTERHRLMGQVEYKNWRKAVFERDNFTCCICGAHGVELNADHKIPYYVNKSLVFDVDNGQTLCVPCHKSLPTYGHKVKTQYLRQSL